MNFTITDIKVIIVRKLVQWRKWGGSHTENLISGLPSHLRGDKLTKKALKELVKDRWLLPAMKTGETHYSLNPKKSEEIIKFYEKHSKR